MRFLTRSILPTDLWDQRKHHKIYNQAKDIFERANTKVDVFYSTIGRRPSKADIKHVNSLVASLQTAQAALQNRIELATNPETRAKVGDRDYDYMTKHERRLADWLEKVMSVQKKLQKQVDAETWFSEEDERRSKESKKSKDEHLKDKPLPPLRRTSCHFKTSVMLEEKAIEAGETILFLDDDMSPIIDFYLRETYDADGFVTLPRYGKEWI